MSERLINRSKEIKNKGYILNVETYEKYYSKNQTPYTPSIPHLFGFKKVLDIIFEEGLEIRWQRHKEMAKLVRNWALSMGQSLYAEKKCLSDTVHQLIKILTGILML